MTVGAVLLAAGSSRRMGARNKLVETVGGTPIVARAAAALLAGGASPVVVVTGFERERIESALQGFELELVYNAAHEAGMGGSIAVGIGALGGRAAAALIALGDMPSILAEHVAALIAKFAAERTICVPVRDGRRGHPVLWPADLFHELTSLCGDGGARVVLDRFADRIAEVSIDHSGIYDDVDTVADLDRLRG